MSKYICTEIFLGMSLYLNNNKDVAALCRTCKSAQKAFWSAVDLTSESCIVASMNNGNVQLDEILKRYLGNTYYRPLELAIQKNDMKLAKIFYDRCDKNANYLPFVIGNEEIFKEIYEKHKKKIIESQLLTGTIHKAAQQRKFNIAKMLAQHVTLDAYIALLAGSGIWDDYFDEFISIYSDDDDFMSIALSFAMATKNKPFIRKIIEFNNKIEVSTHLLLYYLDDWELFEKIVKCTRKDNFTHIFVNLIIDKKWDFMRRILKDDEMLERIEVSILHYCNNPNIPRDILKLIEQKKKIY